MFSLTISISVATSAMLRVPVCLLLVSLLHWTYGLFLYLLCDTHFFCHLYPIVCLLFSHTPAHILCAVTVLFESANSQSSARSFTSVMNVWIITMCRCECEERFDLWPLYRYLFLVQLATLSGLAINEWYLYIVAWDNVVYNSELKGLHFYISYCSER